MEPLSNLAQLLALTIIALAAPLAVAAEAPAYTEDFPLDSCRFAPSSHNPYFPLVAGRQAYYNNQHCLDSGECDALEELWITVSPETRSIALRIEGELRTVETRVVEERETENGELVEISRNFFAECRPMQDVYYFGEEVDIYEDGEIVSHDGAWLAGQKRARPGIIMPGPAILLGSRYAQEIAPGVAMDRAEHVAVDLELKLPAGSFDDCVQVTETTPLEPGSESTKVHCPDAGMVIDNDLELVSITGP